MNCSSCGYDNRADSRFCLGCGQKLAQACSGCGRELPPGARFCDGCGRTMSATGAATAAVSAPSPPAAELPGSFAAGRYRVQRFLGEGAKKRVYLARDDRLDREVAFSLIKTEGLDDAGRARVRREAQAMGRLGDHPHIVTVFDIGEENGEPYIVSQYMAGGDAERLLRETEGHRLPLDQLLRIADQICQGLEHAHRRGVVHRDLKPGNVWLTADGTAKLGDFGLALAVDRSRLTQVGTIVGTVAYMPPEQALGRPADARSDLYSVGAILYEMATGRPPFLGDDAVAIISQHINTPPVAPSWHNADVPRALEALILRLLSKAPEDRPENAATVRNALAAISPKVSPVAETAAHEDANPLDRLAGGVFVGREKEMDQLRGGLEDALSGRGRLLMLVGEPGIGKTRTSEELATYARLRNAQVLWGRCYEGEGAPAYWPWVQLVRSYVHNQDPRTLMSEMGPGAADIAQVVSEVRERLPGLPTPATLEPEQARFRLLDSITNFLRNASKRQPLVLIVDDLHWADKPSLLLLQFLAHELRGTRVLVLGTYRDVELRRHHPLSRTLAELAREQQSERILLRGLSDRDVSRFIETTAGIRPPAALVQAVYRETEGNPFFVNEIVRLLVADGRLEKPEEVTSWSVTIPQGVREVVGRRLDHLSEECNRILTVASVLGREFDLEALDRVGQLSGDRLLEVLEEAVDARVVAEVPRTTHRYSFTHALIRETLYEELSTTRRLRLHRQIGDVLEGLYRDKPEPHLAELAYHFCEAAPGGDVERAVQYATRAAQRAMEMLAYEEASSHYERALQALELKEPADEEQRCALLLSLGEAQHFAGDHVQAMETCLRAADLARALGSGELLARAANGFALPRWVTQTPPDTTIRLLEEASGALGEEETALHVQVLAHLAMALLSASDERKKPVSRRALDMARRVGDPETLVWALGSRHFALLGTGSTEERLDIANELVELAEKAETNFGAMWGHERRMVDLLELGDLAAAQKAIEAATQFGEETRVPWLIALTQLYRGMLALLQGRFGDCERLVVEAFATGNRLQSANLMGNAQGQIFGLRWAQGRLAELDGIVQRNAEVIRHPVVRIALAFWYAQMDRKEEAREQFERFAGNSFRDLPRDGFWLAGVGLLSEVCVALADASRAQVLYGLLQPLASRNAMLSVSMCLGSVSRYLGLLTGTLGRVDDAARHFEDALEMNTKLGARPLAAQTRYEYARLLVERDAAGDRQKALELVGAALDTAQELGMTALLEKALAFKLKAQGVDSSDPTHSVYAVASTVHRQRPDLTRHVAPNGTVTLMFSDMEGFTAMTERLGDLKAREVIRRHNGIVREQLAAHGGYEVELQGDGFLLAFASARSAILCAVAIQRAFAAYNREHAEEPIRVRIGLHTGETLKDADKFFGKAVILAARIAAQAKGGEILVSSLLRDLTASVGDLRFGAEREVDLKGISETQSLVRVDWE